MIGSLRRRYFGDMALRRMTIMIFISLSWFLAATIDEGKWAQTYYLKADAGRGKICSRGFWSISLTAPRRRYLWLFAGALQCAFSAQQSFATILTASRGWRRHFYDIAIRARPCRLRLSAHRFLAKMRVEFLDRCASSTSKKPQRAFITKATCLMDTPPPRPRRSADQVD